MEDRQRKPRRASPALARWAVASVLAVGCGDNGGTPTYAPLFQNGDRLQAIYLDGGPGARVFQGWWDAELDIGCSFSSDELGTVRCLPSGDDIAYADPDCTQPIAVSYSPCPADLSARYRREYLYGEPSECGNASFVGVAIYRVGDSLGTMTTYGKSGDQCHTSGEGNAFAVTRVPAADFVAARERIDAHPDGLDVVVYEANDGATQTFGYRNHATGNRCYPEPVDTELNLQCLSSPGYLVLSEGDSVSNRYSDAACSNEVWVTGGYNGCQMPEAMLVYERSGDCSWDITLHAAGPEVSPVYSSQEGECVAGPEGSTKWFEIGAPLEGSTFPTVGRGVVGRGAISVGVLVDAEGVTIAGGYGFVDNTRGESCEPIAFTDDPDGVLRCASGALQVHSPDLFSDPECLEPVGRYYQSECHGPVPPFAIVSTFTPDACSTTSVRLHELNEYSGPLYVSPNCAPTTIEEQGGGFVAVRAGAEVSPDTFPAMTLVVP
jgi:hypothetical protein